MPSVFLVFPSRSHNVVPLRVVLFLSGAGNFVLDDQLPHSGNSVLRTAFVLAVPVWLVLVVPLEF